MKISGREITALAARIVAIIVLVMFAMSSASTLVTLAQSVTAEEFETSAMSYIWYIGVAVSLASLLVIGLLLWRFSAKVISESAHEEPSSDVRSLEPIILGGLGVWFVANGLIGLINTSAAYLVALFDESIFLQYSSSHWMPGLVGHIFRIIIGLTLVIGAKGWAALFQRLREARY